MAEKIIRDPVHDVIAFELQKPADALLFKLINAEEFQRLRRIRQLGMASLAYPGADHCRYSHSLGVMQTARRMLQQLGRTFAIDEQEATVCLAAALLHDVGHGPLSHVFEHLSGVGHETITLAVVEQDSQVHRILAEYDRQLPQQVADLLRRRAKRRFLSDVISSQLDADRFDYLLRDNLHTGSRYGDFDLQWLLHALTIAGDRLAVTWKGVSAVEAYLQSRYHMYRNVYFHKVVRAAEGMLRLAVQRAHRLAVQQRLAWPGRDDPAYKALLGQHLTIEEFLQLDDVSVLQCLKQWSSGDDATLAKLSRGLLYRRLFKTIDLSAIDDPARVLQVVERAGAAIKAAGGEPEYEMFYDEPADTPYEIYDGRPSADEILVQDAQGKLTNFAKISPLAEVLGKQLMFRRLHVSEPYRTAAQAVIA
ncbi:MAG: HD domain-containing protein [Tepidisphaeraceae bacterium]|jgi:hypothetical protein